jgi:hypothetical protein
MNVNDPSTKSVLTAIQALLMAVGGALVNRGYTDNETVKEIVGAFMVLLPAMWAAIDHYRAEEATKAREAVAVNVGIAVADRTPGVTSPVPADKAPAVIEAFRPVVPAPDAPAQNPTGLAIQPSSPILTDPPKGSTP